MRIDYEYVKKLLDVFLDSSLPTINLRDFSWLKFSGEPTEDTHKFVFHMEILRDQHLVESILKNRNEIGISRTAHDYIWSIVDLRLTALGHDFASALNKPGVISTLATTFKDLGPGEAVRTTIKLAVKATEKALSSLVDD